MRVALTTFGSVGDHEPFLALAIELQRHGHHPVLACTPQYGERASQFGVEFAPVGPPSLFEAMRRSLKLEIEHGLSSAVEDMRRYPVSDLLRTFNDLSRVCDGVDLMICNATWPFGKWLHETTGIPYVSVRPDRHNERYARESRQHLSAWEEHLAKFLEPYTTLLGLEPWEHSLTTDGDSPQLALFAVSRLMLDPELEPQWDSRHHVTGFFFVDEPWQPPAELEEFVAGGPPPIVFAFGSMQYDDPQLADLLLEVVGQTRQRAIFAQGWSHLFEGREPPEGVKVVDFVPYNWLFPRAACVAHAGGAGTTAWALRSGTPVICIPPQSQQYSWQHLSYARFAEDTGGGVMIPLLELNAARLREAITEVLTNPGYKEAARATSAQIRAEGGVRLARELIERWFHGLPQSSRITSAQIHSPGLRGKKKVTSL
ncbi:MAG: glycosyltransferase [Acidobacteria bacterium]|nr:glycosyltransferase [Acidobacteriota bacterium]